jgi:hypothetical protein
VVPKNQALTTVLLTALVAMCRRLLDRQPPTWLRLLPARTLAGSETMPRVETMFVFRTTGPLIT